jgi:hypothetical protein
MRNISLPVLTLLLIMPPSQASAAGHVQLKLEERTTLHVGQIATLRLPSGRPYRVESAGDALVLIKPAGPAGVTVQPVGTESIVVVPSAGAAVFIYRAAHPGDETIITVPSDHTPDNCVDCVTQHYFVTVVP